MLPEGNYRAKAQDAVLALTSTGKEQIAIEFILLGEAVMGQRITWYGYFTEKTFDRTIESMRYCGWTGDDLSDLSGIGANEVELVVGHEENQEGQTIARVRWVNRVGGIAVKDRMDETQTRRFAAEMRGRIAALGGGGTRKPNRQAKPAGAAGPGEPPPLGDDDIPFRHRPVAPWRGDKLA